MENKSTNAQPTTEAQTDANAMLADEVFADSEDDSCPECKCCSTVWHECEHCGGEGGFDGDDLMEEDPLWYDQDDYEQCDVCEGNGGWKVCIGECVDGKHGH